MGLLLKEAEKISIDYNLNDPQLVMDQLQHTSIWPKPQ